MGMTIHELRQIKETLVLLDNPTLPAQLRDEIDQSIRLIVREIKLKEIDPRK